ncbi:uncharacterized protein LOC110690579 [Chenopodium quinoa]|uniref:uncharacterized protein LOC110690579 n=1 Tax=Chenopodium quinoa TaxID=63459 RepID=UPI000B779C1F|nr:uncharacterized protein LOC110690579 [Chenopodium quinoa]
MEPPFFNIHYQTPTPPQFRRFPVNIRPTAAAQTTPSRRRKVISIPIHDENSLRKRSDSAIRIQKVFRGFRVRKPVKKILELKGEVDAVEKKLQERETMKAIKRDRMERLKVNESLMVLLFKLDSVRGFNDEIRVLRKMVIRKAIRLQEMIDSAIDETADDNCEKSDEVVEKSDEVVEDTTENSDDSTVMNVETSPRVIDETLEKSEEVFEDADDFTESLSKMQVEDSEKLEENSEVAVDAMQVETVTGSDETWECVSCETEEHKSGVVEAGKEDDHVKEECEDGCNSAMVEKGTPPRKEDWFVVNGDEEEKRKKDKLLEKMAADNERLVAMVADLCQKNVVQSQLICSLSQRVEQLEKAMSERLRKKKKKSNATTQI